MMESQTYVVAGAAKAGIGEAITRRLLNEGHTVIGTYEKGDETNAAHLRSAFDQTRRLTLRALDLASRDDLRSFCESLPSNISGIVFAEFYFTMQAPTDAPGAEWDRSLAINLTAPHFLVSMTAKKLRDGASVIIVTSTEGFIGSFGAPAYAATKAAIHNLVKSLANTLGTRHVRVNALAAGWIGGVMDTDEVFNLSRRITPLGRLGRPDEIAAVTNFLLSDESSFVNGTTIIADGGYTGVDTIAKYEFDQFLAAPHKP
jgi:NAD(P)-dependent dehydrogenase (short-subunit alcohol dehydrogenase family)